MIQRAVVDDQQEVCPSFDKNRVSTRRTLISLFVGLRQQPPQRVLFQPDVSSSRNVRHSSGHAQSPQPTSGSNTHTGYNYSNPNSSFFSITNYEPRAQIPMTLRPITTPGNNHPAFKAQLKRARDQKRILLGITSPPTQGMMKPGAGFEGPNIYVRTLQGLRSPVPEEQSYALHHLVKISHERGDKYKFEAFPGLAEGLVEFVLQVSTLFFDIKWQISYTEDEHEIYTLDGVNGTPDILQRIQCLNRIDRSDDLQDAERSSKLTKILEACLTIRNLSLLEENARYLSDMPQLRDFLSIALNLPEMPQVAELKHYALDVSEQVIRFWTMDPSDPLYKSLLSQIDGGRDRGAILTSLRALSRISLNLEEPNLLQDVPTLTIRKVCEWIILDDDDLATACLDFLHQYTAVPANLAHMLSQPFDLPLIPLLGQLTRFLQYHATSYVVKDQLTKAIKPKPAEEIPRVPLELFEQFVKHEEPDRSNSWLRSVFEEDPESSITQLTLWQAYQNLFTEYVSRHPQSGLLPAAEFIKNVSAIFTTANAQVVQGAVTKFIIKGIRPRHAPIDSKGRTYSRCLWMNAGYKQCGEFQLKPRHMFEHIAVVHLGLKRKAEGDWDFGSSSLAHPPLDCYWGECKHFSKTIDGTPSLYDIGRHVKTHLPDISTKAPTRLKYNRTLASQSRTPGDPEADTLNYDPEQGSEATFKEIWFRDTVKDERGVASGLPLTTGLFLRNIARNIPRAVNLMEVTDKDQTRKQLMEQLLVPLKDRLLFSMAHNRPLGPLMADIVAWIERGTR